MADQLILWFRAFDSDRLQTSIATQITATDAERQSLADALQLWSAGNSDGVAKQIEMEAPTGVAASSPVAQRRSQLIIEMKDNLNGKVYRDRLPFPNTNKAQDAELDPAWISVGQGSNTLTVANPAHADYTTLKTELEATWVSPNGNTGQFVRAFIEE